MSYVKVHTALFTTKEFVGKSKAGRYGDNVEEMDWSVGKIIGKLRELNLLEDTLILFSSDNGPYLERNKEGGSSGFIMKNGEKKYLRGGKGQNWEGGVRVPTIVQWNGKIKGNRTINELVTLMDLFPTMAELTNQKIPSGLNVDGKSLIPILTENKTTSHQLFVHLCGDTVSAVRYKGRFKLHFTTPIWDHGKNNCPSKVICGCDGEDVKEENPPLLFDLEEDPSEEFPISPQSEKYKQISIEINNSLSKLKPSLSFPPSRLHSLFNPLLMPCCNFPFCECSEPLSN